MMEFFKNFFTKEVHFKKYFYPVASTAVMAIIFILLLWDVIINM